MKQGWKKRLTVVLALMLALTVLPLVSVWAESAATYGKVTMDKVYLRKQPSTGADYWFRMDTGHVAQILDEVTQNGKSWYKVETGHPDNNGRTYTGYIMKDYVTQMTAEEVDAWLAGRAPTGPSTSSGTPSSGTGSSSGSQSSGTVTVTGWQGEVTAGGTNFRMLPSTSGAKIMSLERGTIVEITSIPETIDANHWYGARYAGYSGYIMSTFIRLLPEDTSSSVGNVLVHGFVKLTRSSANLRSAPNGTIAISDGWKGAGSILPYVSTPVVKDGYTWYEVVFEGTRYWVRSDCVQTVDSTGQSVTPSTPTTAPGASTTQGYVITTIGGVNLRLQPWGDSFEQIKKGVVLPYEHVVGPYTENNNSNYSWYYVVYNNMHGYVRSDCVAITSGGSSAPTTKPTATPVPTATVTPTAAPSYSYVMMVKTDVALRTTPGGKVQERLPLGTVVPLIGTTIKASSYTWYPVRAASGNNGYVRGDCVVLCNEDGSTGAPGTTATPGITAGPDVTTAPDVTEAPTAVPTATPEPTTGVYGYVQITIDRTFIRATMNGDKLFRVEKKGGIYPMWGQPGNKNNYVWYPIVIEGVNGWVRGDCAKIVDAGGATAAPTETPAPTDNPNQGSSYVITILDKVFLRVSASMDANTVARVPLGTVLAFKGTTSAGGYQWYHATYNGKDVWVRGDCVRVMTQAEYDAWLQQQTPSNTPPTETVIGYVKTIANNVNVRKTANGAYADVKIAKSGTVLAYTETRTVNNVIWYYIIMDDGFRGWINGNFATETSSSGTPNPTTPPSVDEDYVPPTKGQEAAYTTLRRGSSGQAVTNLVTELKLQGYYTGAITSSYNAAVEEAVKAFQKAKGLKVDGVAGSETQHALFQTVPIGSGSNIDFTFYPAEKIDWFTGTINKDWAKGTSAKIYDIRTGIVWTARRWSGGNHAEVEPLTAADTVRLCKSYGVSKASDIPWNYRPVLVLIDDHNYCASIYAQEHTSSSDGVIKNNNYTGTMCVHFTNSKTHETNIVNSGHQKDIEEAYNNAPGGQKK